MDKELDSWICKQFGIRYRPLDELDLLAIWFMAPKERFPCAVVRRKGILHIRLIAYDYIQRTKYKRVQTIWDANKYQVWRCDSKSNRWETTTPHNWYSALIMIFASGNYNTYKQSKNIWNERRRTLSNGDWRQQ